MAIAAKTFSQGRPHGSSIPYMSVQIDHRVLGPRGCNLGQNSWTRLENGLNADLELTTEAFFEALISMFVKCPVVHAFITSIVFILGYYSQIYWNNDSTNYKSVFLHLSSFILSSRDNSTKVSDNLSIYFWRSRGKL